MYRRLAFLLFLIVLLLGSCSPVGIFQLPWMLPPEQPTHTVTVFAAASLTEAYSELRDNFEDLNPDIQVVLNFAGSQQLAQQLAQGAPADVFASANLRQIEVAVQANRVDPSEVGVFAYNHLLVIYPAYNPASLQELQDLANPGLRLILADKSVPVGQYTLKFLENASSTDYYGPMYQRAVLTNVVSYEENVKAVLSKVALGEADAGIVYVSDAQGPIADKVGSLQIPKNLNVKAEYYLAPILDSHQKELGAAFIGKKDRQGGAHQKVPQIDHECGRDDRPRGGAPGDHGDGNELRATGENENRHDPDLQG